MILLSHKQTKNDDVSTQKFIVQAEEYTISELNKNITVKIPQISITCNNQLKAVTFSIDTKYTARVSQNLLTALGLNIKDKELTGKYIPPPSKPKILPKSIKLYCKQIDGNYNEIDGQPSQQLCSIDIDGNAAATYNPKRSMFLPLSNNEICQLHFKLLDENRAESITEAYHLLLYNK